MKPMISRVAPAASTVLADTRPVSNDGTITSLVMRPSAMVMATAAPA